MKKSTKISIALGALTFAVVQFNSALAATGIVNTETVRMRAKATTDSSIVEMIDIGREVEIIGTEGNWYKVKYNGKEGYIRNDFLRVSGDSGNQSTSGTSQGQVQEEPKNLGPENPAIQTEPVYEVNTDNIPKPQETPAQTTTSEEKEKEEPEKQEEENEGNEEQPEENQTEVVVKEQYIYLLPSISSIKIQKLEEDKSIKVVSKIANWTKVQIDSVEGWVPNTYLETENNKQDEEGKPEEQEKQPEQTEQKPEEQTPETTEKEINQNGYVSYNGDVNLRSGPGTNTEAIDSLAKNSVVTVVSEENDWYKVTYNGKEGYILKSLVTLGSAPEEVSSRSLEEPRTVAASSAIVETAQGYLGSKYVSGGSSPSQGFDCSGFTQYVYKQYGISLPRVASAQASNGVAVANKSSLEPGDLVYFHYYGSSTIDHVGIYVGDGKFVHAANSKRGVVTDSIMSGYYAENYIGGRRL